MDSPLKQYLLPSLLSRDLRDSNATVYTLPYLLAIKVDALYASLFRSGQPSIHEQVVPKHSTSEPYPKNTSIRSYNKPPHYFPLQHPTAPFKDEPQPQSPHPSPAAAASRPHKFLPAPIQSVRTFAHHHPNHQRNTYRRRAIAEHTQVGLIHGPIVTHIIDKDRGFNLERFNEADELVLSCCYDQNAHLGQGENSRYYPSSSPPPRGCSRDSSGIGPVNDAVSKSLQVIIESRASIVPCGLR